MKKTILGAEAKIVINSQEKIVVKERLSKKYRHPVIDKRLITRRTKIESNILKKLNSSVNTKDLFPKFIGTKDENITMSLLDGVTFQEFKFDNYNQIKVEELYNKIADNLAKALIELHKNGIVHGDVTPRNIIINIISHNKNDEDNEIQVGIIDFGLAQSTHRIEDKANDLWMTRETFVGHANFSSVLMKSYLSKLEENQRILFEERFEKMTQRGRHRTKNN